jgi:Tol biopolymer transport system component
MLMRQSVIALVLAASAALTLACGNSGSPAPSTPRIATSASPSGSPIPASTSLAPVTAAAASPTATPATPETRLQIGLFLVNADGTGLRRIVDQDVMEVAWSPHGESLAFVERHTGALTILDLPSQTMQRLASPRPGAPSWAPSGPTRILVTTAGPDDAVRTLEVFDVASGERHSLAPALTGFWAPDGTRVALGGETCDRLDHLRVYDPQRSAITALTPSYPDAAVFISPDWRQIAYFREGPVYTADPTQRSTLYVASIDGSNEHPLPTDTLRRGYPSWSPDDSWIEYTTRGNAGEDGAPYLLRSDGAAPSVQLAEHGYGSGWSPDSSKLLIGTPDGLYVYDVGADARDAIASGITYHAAWSPDGSRIAYIAPVPDENAAALLIYDVSAKQTVRVGDATIYAAVPVWSPDGAEVAFLGIPGGYGSGPCQ